MTRRFNFTVYGLIDPRDLALRYVGITTHSLNSRLRAHIRCAANNENRLWFAELALIELEPQIVPIERFERKSHDFAACIEALWIRAAERAGCNLTNEHRKPDHILDHFIGAVT